MKTMTKIDIFSGFLGAGKTTLIKKLIAEAFQGEKLVLIENEFGEIGIDGGFLQDAGIQITEMSQGCICCSLVGDFGKALEKVGGALGMNETGSAGMVANLENNIAMFNILGDMNPKGKLLNVAFAVSAAFVFGDHLGFTAGNNPDMIFPVVVGKLVAGITAVVLASFLSPKLLSKIESAKK